MLASMAVEGLKTKQNVQWDWKMKRKDVCFFASRWLWSLHQGDRKEEEGDECIDRLLCGLCAVRRCLRQRGRRTSNRRKRNRRLEWRRRWNRRWRRWDGWDACSRDLLMCYVQKIWKVSTHLTLLQKCPQYSHGNSSSSNVDLIDSDPILRQFEETDIDPILRQFEEIDIDPIFSLKRLTVTLSCSFGQFAQIDSDPILFLQTVWTDWQWPYLVPSDSLNRLTVTLSCSFRQFEQIDSDPILFFQTVWTDWQWPYLVLSESLKFGYW